MSLQEPRRPWAWLIFDVRQNQKQMRAARWIIGSIAFVSPVVVAFVGRKLDHSTLRSDSIYKALIPAFALGSLGLAAFVPGCLIMTSKRSLWRRIGFTAGILLLLIVELCWTFFAVVVTP